MKSMSLLFYVVVLMAFEVHANENSASDVDYATIVKVEPDSLDQFSSKEQLLDSGKHIRFMKNPCAGIKGYRLQRVRGFGFENGVVTKFQMNGQISLEKNKYKSLGSFLRERQICHPQNNKMTSYNFNFYLAEIWP